MKTSAAWTAAIGLLALYLWMALSAARLKGPAFDEIGHLTSGYNVWLRHDFRLDPGNGDLVKRWAALPLWWTRPAFPPETDPMWRQGEQQALGFQFFFQSGNDPARLLASARAMVAVLGAILGLLVFAAARSRFGSVGGLIALTAFVFCPHMLAHGALVTTDLSVTLLLFAAALSLWRLLEAGSWPRAFLSAGVFGLLCLAKLSAVAVWPLAAVLIAVRARWGGPWTWTGRRSWLTRGSPWRIGAVLVGLHLAAAWAIIWADYDFRFSAARRSGGPAAFREQTPGSVKAARAPLPPDLPLTFQAQPAGLTRGRLDGAFDWAQRHRVLPEGFLHGTAAMLRSTGGRGAFMNGEWWTGGWRAFFPYAFAVKTSPALLALVGLGLAGWIAGRRDGWVAALYPLTPLLALGAVYFAVAQIGGIDIGHRHILPVYPPLFVLAGAAAGAWPGAPGRSRAGAAALLLFYAAESWAVRPDYLTYFNRLAGGPSQGFRHLVDSSLDWGMDLPGLQRWLAVHDPQQREPVYLAYFGTGSPEYYGIRSRRLPGFFDWRPHAVYPLGAGLYAISATLLESVYTRTFGPWTPVYEARYRDLLHRIQSDRTPLPAEAYDYLEALRFGRLCAWLRNKRSADAAVGHSILIWRLSVDDLRAALLGPPAELLPPIAGPRTD